MSNLVEIAKDLEYVPDEQLIQLANGSDPRFPPFVVISEIKRRTDMRSRSLQPMPKTTVAQEMVQEFAMPSRQGLEGMSQDATGILPPTVYNRDMPSSMMADGGLVGYADKGQTVIAGGLPNKEEYDKRLEEVEKLANMKAVNKEAFMNQLMGEGYTDPRFIKSTGNPLIDKYGMQPFPAEGSGFIPTSKQLGIEGPEIVFRPQSRGSYDTNKDTVNFKDYEGIKDARLTQIHEFMHRAAEKTNYFDNYYNSDYIKKEVPFFAGEYGRILAPAVNEALAHSYEYDNLNDEDLKKDIEFRVSRFNIRKDLKPKVSSELFKNINKLRKHFEDYLGNFDKEKMQKNQEGGLTSYQTGNQTALSNTFMYTPTIEGNVPISEQGLYRLLEERGITSEEERQEISDILNSGLARFSLPRQVQLAGAFKRSDDFIAQPYKGIDSPFGRMYDRRSFADEILEGVSPGPQMPKGYVPPVDTSGDGDKDKDIDIQDDDNPNKDTGDGKPTGLASANPQLELPEPPKPPTAAQRQQELNANVLMTLGSAIGSSTTPQEIFKNLSGLPAQLMAIKSRQRQEDKDYKADLRANIKDKANYDIALKKLDVSITAARNSKNSDLVKYLGELKDLFTEASSESERTKLMEEINAVSSSIFSALVGKSPSSNDTDALNAAITAGTKS
tara:strand:+ start:1234 stop:3243 length:2010 start_codon:yes stop_codon:yes gene_type:complete